MTKKPMTFELCRGMQNLLVDKTAQIFHYKWPDDFCRQEIKEAFTNNSANYELDPNTLTDAQLAELGFQMWSKEQDKVLRLIPLWLFSFIKDGTVLTSISGDVKVKGIDDDKIDLDIRAGCIAFGIEQTITQH